MMGDDWDPNGYELWQNDVGAWQIYRRKLTPNWPWFDGLRHAVECIHNGTRPRGSRPSTATTCSRL